MPVTFPDPEPETTPVASDPALNALDVAARQLYEALRSGPRRVTIGHDGLDFDARFEDHFVNISIRGSRVHEPEKLYERFGLSNGKVVAGLGDDPTATLYPLADALYGESAARTDCWPENADQHKLCRLLAYFTLTRAQREAVHRHFNLPMPGPDQV